MKNWFFKDVLPALIGVMVALAIIGVLALVATK